MTQPGHDDSSTPVRTTCAYCGVGCGIVVERTVDGRFDVNGDPAHPANFGRLCAKGKSLAETLGADDRLRYPEINGAQVTWDRAIATVADRFNAVIAEHGPDAVAFYVSGQLLTEDYYVANKLMKGFIGSGNIDTNSRLCMASSVAGHKRAFGEDLVPGTYNDLEQADLVVLVGSNLAWCHPVLHQRLLAARADRGTKVVVIDPRETATTADCDLHLPLNAGSDVALFNGLLRHLDTTGRIDSGYIARHTRHYDAAIAVSNDYDSERVTAITGLATDALERFYKLFAATERVVTVYSQGVNQSSAGSDKVNAIINCHIATGRIGLPGAGPFSVTGQPNAMGGRETGGLANTLASHIEFDDVTGAAALADYWHTPRLAREPGLKAVDLFDAVADGRIKALWIMATNPAVSLPHSDRVRDALANCPFVVVSDVVRRTDTADHASVLLPATGWGEKDGTVTNSERRISRQRAFTSAPGDAQADWWIVSRVAQAMGFRDAFDYASPDAIFREYAGTTMLAGDRPRVLSLGALRNTSAATYAALAPLQWPCADNASALLDQRLLAGKQFPTEDGRARFVATPWRAPVAARTPRHPLILTSGRIRDQWHTMTRSGLAAQLSAHIAEPYVEIHPETATEYGIGPAEVVSLSNTAGRACVRALVTSRVPRRTLFVPMHWSDQNAAHGAINRLFEPHCDPVSGQPELKHTVVELCRFDAAWYGFALTHARPAAPDTAYWARMRTQHGWRLEMASLAQETNPDRLFRELCGPLPVDAELTVYDDAARGVYRAAATVNGRVAGLLYIDQEPVAVARSWAAAALGTEIDPAKRQALLAGVPGCDDIDEGALVCSCNGIGRRRITAAIRTGSITVDDVGRQTLAGTNCGSCRMEIRAIIDTVVPAASR